MTQSRPQFAVIIPHFNDHDRLRRCLSALMRNDTRGCEIVVVDNQSDVPLDDLQDRFPDVRFVVEPTKGAAAARNRGVVETTAPYLFFLDADCVPKPNWLTTARNLAMPSSVIGGRIDVFDEGTGPRTGAQAFETVFAFDQRSYIEEKGFSVTANLLTSRAVFQDVGPMTVGVSEDLDWCHRATAKGYHLLYSDDLIVEHPSRSDWPALRKKWRRLTEESFMLAEGRATSRWIWGLRAILMPVSILAHAPRMFSNTKLDDAGEKMRGFATLTRLRLVRSYWMLQQAMGIQ